MTIVDRKESFGIGICLLSVAMVILLLMFGFETSIEIMKIVGMVIGIVAIFFLVIFSGFGFYEALTGESVV